MNLWRDLEPGPQFPESFFLVVEVAQGGRNKYKFHRPTGAIKLDRVLATAARYPGDYGLVPQTLDVDGDPVNVLVMTNLPTFPGCIMRRGHWGCFACWMGARAMTRCWQSSMMTRFCRLPAIYRSPGTLSQGGRAFLHGV